MNAKKKRKLIADLSFSRYVCILRGNLPSRPVCVSATVATFAAYNCRFGQGSALQSLTISVQLLPLVSRVLQNPIQYLREPSTIYSLFPKSDNTSSVIGSRVRDGSSAFVYRSLHCISVRPAMCLWTLFQFPTPYTCTAAINAASSCWVQRQRRMAGLIDLCQRCKHCWPVLLPNMAAICCQFRSPICRTAFLNASSSSFVHFCFTALLFWSDW